MRTTLSAIASAAFVSSVAACSDVQMQCQYAPQFRVAGIVYGGTPERIAEDRLAREVGVLAGIPSAAERCEPFTLADEEGTLAPGTKIHTVVGVDPSEGLAVVETSADFPVLYHAPSLQPRATLLASQNHLLALP